MQGIIDIGSNTIRMNIYRIEEDGTATLLMNKKDMTGLASYITDGYMTAAGIDTACEVLSEFKALLDDFNIQGHAFATAALRNVSNSKAAVAEIAERSGMPIEVLSGEDEARLDFLGVTQTVPLERGVLIDIGGASTEIVIYDGKDIKKAFSMPLGSLNMYNQHVANLLPTKQERKEIKYEVLKALAADEDFLAREQWNVEGMCGVGGTLRAAGRLNYALFDVTRSNRTLTRPAVKKIIRLLENYSKDTLVSTDSLELLLRYVPERVRTILPGMIILHTLMKFFYVDTIEVSKMGVREGYLYQRILKKEATDNEEKA